MAGAPRFLGHVEREVSDKVVFMNPWALYDDLIAPISPDITVKNFQAGPIWTWLEASDGTIGLAMTIDVRTRPSIYEHSLLGRPLHEAGQLIRSWNLVDAGVGVAAINAWYNHSDRSEACGDRLSTNGGAFDTYIDMVRGKKVATIGHFPFIEQRLGKVSELSIIERNPRKGDFTDSAAEYLLPEQDVVFITGSAMVNKTLPRLLQLSRHAHVVLTGPSTPLAPAIYDYGVDGLSGMVITDAERLKDSLKGTGNEYPQHSGVMLNYAKRRSAH